MKLSVFALIFAICLCPAWSQIAQDHPEYCGIPGGVNPPLSDIGATIDSGGHAILFIGRGRPTNGIPLEGSLVANIPEVCPISSGKLVVFADIGGAIAIYIVDRIKGSVLDYFWAYSPLISPDQRWIVYDKFYALHGVEGTSEYLIYDLAKAPTQNRPNGDASNFVDVGAVIFPPGQKNLDDDNTGVPRNQLHGRGSGFSWASDSRAVLFVDTLADNPKKIILVTFDEKGAPMALEHEVTARDVCGSEMAGSLGMWKLDRAEVGPDRGGTRTVVVDLHSDDRRCAARMIQLYKSDFQPATTEVHVLQEPKHGMIKEGNPPMSPPKKK